MEREKKPVHKVVMTEGRRDIIRQIIRSTTYRMRRISRTPSKTCWEAPSRK